MGAQCNYTPKASPNKKKSQTLKDLFDLDSKASTFSDSDSIEQILSIISDCNFTFPLAKHSDNIYQSPSQHDNLKRLKLTHLLCLIKSLEKPLHEYHILFPLISMLTTNLFRPLPPATTNTSLINVDQFPENTKDLSIGISSSIYPSPAWAHLQIVYNIIQWLINNTDPEILKEYINQTFLSNLLSLFQSEEPRERESLKNIYHKIYYKFTFYRSFMRKSMTNVFLEYIFETDKNCGIGDMLEIWGSIINGFTVPIKEEHRVFFRRVVMPLHKAKGMQVYHKQLAYCVGQFVQKEPDLCGEMIRGILRYWPVTNCQKEVLLIGELEDLVESSEIEESRNLAVPLCRRIAGCLTSMNSQVAERALCVWNNEQFVKMVSLATDQVFPVLVQGLEKNLNWHWNNNVRQSTDNVKVMLEDMDPVLYAECLREIELRELEELHQEIKRNKKWETIHQLAGHGHIDLFCRRSPATSENCKWF